jgi:branched-chain amino acid transport system ATP-binding protein
MSAPAVLTVNGLVKSFGGLLATDHVDLELGRGEIHALIGPNGAGKTTLIHQLSGTLRSDAGTIRLDGADITRMPMEKRVRLGLARSYQITSIFERLSVADNIALAVQAQQGSSRSLFRPARGDLEVMEKAAEVAARAGLGDRLATIAGGLAHGEQRLLEIALTLATGARVLLLDEPMAGLGPDETLRMAGLIDSLSGEHTILLVEHDMDTVFRLSDTITVLVSGQVAARGTPDEIRNNADVKRAYLGDELEHS